MANAFRTPVLTPSRSPGMLTSKTNVLRMPTTGGSVPQPASISYSPTLTVVCANASPASAAGEASSRAAAAAASSRAAAGAKGRSTARGRGAAILRLQAL